MQELASTDNAPPATKGGTAGGGHLEVPPPEYAAKGAGDAELKEDPENGEAEEEEAKTIDTKGTMSRLLREIDGIKCDFFLGTFGGLISGGSLGGFAIAFQELAFNLMGGTDPDEIEDGALLVAIAFLSIGVGMWFGSIIQFWMFGRASAKVSIYLRKQYFAALLQQDITYFDQESTGVLQARINSETKAIETGFGSQLALAVQHVGESIAGLAIALNASVIYTLILLAFLPLLMIAGGIQGKILINISSKTEDIFSKAVSRSAEVLSGIRTVKSLDATDVERKRFDEVVDEIWPLKNKSGLLGGFGMGFTMFIMFGVTYAFGMWYGTIQVAKYHRTDEKEGFDAGVLFGVFFGIIFMGMGLGQLAAIIPEYQKAIIASATLYQVVDRSPVIKGPSDGKGLKPAIKGDIVLENVTFRYPTRMESWVFKDFNLKIKAGQTVALVGPSGCGKSTIVAFLERFYDLEGGRILVDGTEIHEYDLAYLRKSIGFVGQEPILFNTSIKNNIKMGVEDEVSDEEVIQAAKMANAYDFIMKFPDQFETNVGEKGSQMSGGQKQRISIARALCRNPKILLLDEATSALDTESESIVQAALDRIMAESNLTTIVIAHRLSTIKDADKIVVIHEGRVEQQGTHDELCKDQDGIYATMLKSQQLIGDGPRKSRILRQLSNDSRQLSMGRNVSGSKSKGSAII